jgi:pyruvate,water dikinase
MRKHREAQSSHRLAELSSLLACVLVGLAACGDDTPCDPTRQPSRERLSCREEFQAQAARPLDNSLPGAFTVKTVIDQANGDQVHFQDTATYPLHRAFALAQLGYPQGVPFVGEYLLPDRRLLLGAVTHYEDPDLWVYELAPYDTATPEMITKAFRRLRDGAFFGEALRLHLTAREQDALRDRLPEDVRVVTTDEIYRGLHYQPLNLGETIGQLRRLTAAELAAGYVSPREVVVLDRVPEDITVVAGVITEDFQTPLSHVNVLSQQRGTPNMALRDARTLLAAHEGQWVRLTVGAFSYHIGPATQAEADAFWAGRRPGPTAVPPPDFTRQALISLDGLRLSDVNAVGGKAAHFGELRRIRDARVRSGFAIPVYYYGEFMQQNGFDNELATLLADERFRSDGLYRKQALATLQMRMRSAPVSASFLAMLETRINTEFPATRMRFRSSTNAEDLRGHSGAGLYDSASGQPGDVNRPVDSALREVWSSLWNFRAFEERDWVRIDQTAVAMGVLVHPTYVDELANGVAVTANPFDDSPDGEDAFYINTQVGEESVVSPQPGLVADQLLYFYFHSGQPATYFARSSLTAAGAPVLSRAELYDLGTQLEAIRAHFAPLYPTPSGVPLPMDVEFKLEQSGAERRIEIKQARPYPGRGHE